MTTNAPQVNQPSTGTTTATFINPTHSQPRREWIVMERYGDTWGVVGASAPKETREAAEGALAALNAIRNATIARLEASITNPDTAPDTRETATRHLERVRASEYAIFTRTISAYERA